MKRIQLAMGAEEASQGNTTGNGECTYSAN